jgi:hypothetical protein
MLVSVNRPGGEAMGINIIISFHGLPSSASAEPVCAQLPK